MNSDQQPRRTSRVLQTEWKSLLLAACALRMKRVELRELAQDLSYRAKFALQLKPRN